MDGIQIVISGVLSESSITEIKNQVDDLSDKIGKINLQFNTDSVNDGLKQTQSSIDDFVTRMNNSLTRLKLGKDGIFNSDEVQSELSKFQDMLESVGTDGGSGIQQVRTQFDNLKTSVASVSQTLKNTDEDQSSITSNFKSMMNDKLGLYDRQHTALIQNQKDIADDLAQSQKIEDVGFKTKLKAITDEYNNQHTALIQNQKDIAGQYTQLRKLQEVLGESKNIDLSNFSSYSDFAEYAKNADDLTAKVTAFDKQIQVNGQTWSTYSARVKDASGMVKDITYSVNDATGEVRKLDSGLKQASSTTMSFGSRVKEAISSMTQWAIAGTALYGTLNKIKEGISFINDLNTSMTNIQMITGMNSDQVADLTSQYSNLASTLHETTSSIMDASEEFLRAGNNASDTSKMLQASTVMSKIAGQSQSDSAESLISIMNAYHQSASQVMDDVDKMVAVDNESATSTAELSTAIQKVASSASSVGVTLPQLISYIGTISSVTRNSADTVGTALNSIISRFASIKEGKNFDPDNNPLNNVEKSLNRYGISIRENATTFKDFSTVLDDVAQKWSKYNDIQKNDIATQLAGTRQRNQFLVLMQNWNKVAGDSNTVMAMQESEANSAGNAMDRYGTYAKSTSAKIDDFTNAIQKMWMQTLNSGEINSFIELGTNIVKFASNLGLVNVAIGVLSGVIFGTLTSALLKGTFTLKGFNAELVKMNILSGGIPLAIGAVVTVLGYFISKAVTSTDSIKTLNSQIKQIDSTYKQAASSADQTKNSTLGQATEAKSLATIIENLNSKEKLNTQEKLEMKSAVQQLNSVLPDLNAKIDSQTGKLTTNTKAIEDNITALKNQAIATAYESKSKAAAIAYADMQDKIGETKTKIDQLTQSVDAQKQKMSAGVQEYADILEKYVGQTDKIDQEEKEIQDLESRTGRSYSINDLSENYLDLISKLQLYKSELSDETNKSKQYESAISSYQQKAIDAAGNETGAVQKTIASFTDATSKKEMASSDFLKTLYKNNSGLKSELASVYGEDSNNFKNFNDVKKQANSLLIQALGQQWEKYYKTQEDALSAIVKAGSASTTGFNLNTSRVMLKEGLISQQDYQNVITMNKQSKEQADQAQALLNAFSAASSSLSNNSSGGSDSGSDSYTPSGTDSSTTKAQTAALHTQQAIIDSINNKEKYLEQTEKNRLNQLNAQKQTLQDQLDLIEKQHTAQQSAEERQKDVDAVNDAKKKLQEAQSNLTETKNQKTELELTTNGWQFIADPSKVKEAADAVTDAQKTLTDAQSTLKEYDENQAYQNKVNSIQSKIDAIEKQSESVQSNYEAQKEALDDQKQTAQEKQQSIKGYASGTDDATSGIHTVAENGAELVTQPSVYNFNGGEVVYDADTTSSILDQNKEDALEPQEELINAMKVKLSNFATDCITYGKLHNTNLGSGIEESKQYPTDKMSDLLKTLNDDLTGFVESGTDYGKSSMQNYGNGVVQNKDIPIDSTNKVNSTLAKNCKDFTNSYVDFGKNLNTQFDKGIKDSETQSKIKQDVDKLSKMVITQFQTDFGVHSPSTVMYEIGGYLMQGLINGMTSEDVQSFINAQVSKSVGGAAGAGLKSVNGNISQWLSTALAMTGTSMDWLPGLEMIASRETGNPGTLGTGDPSSVNPLPAYGNEHAMGLMQIIQDNMDEFGYPGLKDMFNPIDNAIAAIGYIKHKYGSVYNIPNWNNSNYKGYAGGTNNASAGAHEVAEDGSELVVSSSLMNFSGGETVLDNANTKRLLAMSKIGSLVTSLGNNLTNAIYNSSNDASQKTHITIQKVEISAKDHNDVVKWFRSLSNEFTLS